MVVSLLNNTATTVQYFLAYLQKNAWPIIFLLIGGYYLKTKVLDKMHVEGPRDSETRNRSLESDMRRIREKQQEAMAKRAVEAEKERREKEAEEKRKKAENVRKKKNDLDDPYKRTKGTKLGYANDSKSSYNPLNPSSNPTSRYRPSGRTTRRG